MRTIPGLRRRGTTLLLAGRAAALLLPSPTPARASSSAIVDPAAHRAFADGLTSTLHATPNECSSAWGISMAFSLVYPGLGGRAIEQVRTALGYPGGDGDTATHLQLVWEEGADGALGRYAGQCVEEYGGECYASAPRLKIANRVWFDDAFPLGGPYGDVVGDFAKQIDFRAEDSPGIVNEWVSDATNGLIGSIVSEGRPLYPPHALIAVNALYLKAGWATPFRERDTNLDAFYVSPSRRAGEEATEAHFMNAVEYFDYSHDALPGYQLIDLPFAGSTSLSMIFVLPLDEGGGGAVSSARVVAALDGLASTRVALSLPKFKFASRYEEQLKQSLMGLGVTDPFEAGNGALCGIFDDAAGCDEWAIDKVVQKTVIDVNEEGIEAAAVTAAMIVPTSAGPVDETVATLAVLDHPFQFFVYDREGDLVLFEGRVGAPGVPPGEPAAPLYDAKRSDGDFWSRRFRIADPVGPAAAAAPSSGGGSTDGRSFFLRAGLLTAFVWGLFWC